MKQAVGYLVCPHLLRVRLLPQRKARQHIKLGGVGISGMALRGSNENKSVKFTEGLHHWSSKE